MIWDWYASVSSQSIELIDEISLLLKDEQAEKNKERKDSLARKISRELEKLLNIDASLGYRMMAVRHERQAGEVRQAWAQKNLCADYSQELKKWGLYDFFEQVFITNNIDLGLLPPYSFKLCFKFELKKPYISRGQEDFYIIDNPLNRDTVFKVPCVNATAWKGNLRSVLRREGCDDNREDMVRLFGAKSEEDENTVFSKGRLHFMPTFFWKSSLEIINPHDKERRVGKKPILFESVPAGEVGSFTILYVPFDVKNNDREIAAADMELVAKGISRMFAKYGFGAKTSDGFGIADMVPGEGSIEINAEIADTEQDEAIVQPEERFLKYMDKLGKVKEEYLGKSEFGLLSRSEYNEKKEQLGAGSLAEFTQFRNWYKRWGQRWQEHLYYSAEPSKKRLSKITFSSFAEMENVISAIGKTLKEGKSENEH